MRSWDRAIGLVLALTGAVSLVGLVDADEAAAQAAGPSDPCVDAQALLSARFLDAALAKYSGDARTCSDREQAVASLQQAAGERDVVLADAQHASLSGDKAAARTSFLRALAIDAGSDSARSGFEATSQPTAPDPFATARNLLDAGLRSEARAEAVKQIQNGATLKDKAPNHSLWELTHGRGPHWWDTVRSFSRDFLEFLIIVVLLGAVLLALANIGWFERVRRARRKRERLGPAAGPLRRAWRHLTTPHLAVVAGSGDGAEMYAARVRSLVRTVSRSSGSESIAVATYPEPDLDISELAEIDSRLKSLVAAIRVIARRDTVRSATSVEPDDTARLRVAVEMSAPKADARSRVVVDSATAAVGKTAGWVIFSAEDLRPRIRSLVVTPPPSDDRKIVFGTTSASSYCEYLAGVQSYLAGDPEGARSNFTRSVAYDVGNGRAHLNLALTELHSKDPHIRMAGIRRFAWLLETS